MSTHAKSTGNGGAQGFILFEQLSERIHQLSSLTLHTAKNVSRRVEEDPEMDSEIMLR